MRLILLYFFILIVYCSCDIKKSYNYDARSGITSSGNGLSCDNIFLSNEQGEINRKVFSYGEKIFFNFKNVDGFERIQEVAYPSMRLFVLDSQQDTIVNLPDLYASAPDGFSHDPIDLRANLVMASPMKSNQDYTLHINIEDKKSDGKFDIQLDYNVVPNNQLAIMAKKVTYDEIYLYSQQRKTAITTTNAFFKENLIMMFEGLEGFTEIDGKAHLGLSIIAKDKTGILIIDEKDLLKDQPLGIKEVKTRMSPQFIFPGSKIINPVTVSIKIWDKKSDARITSTTSLNIK